MRKGTLMAALSQNHKQEAWLSPYMTVVDVDVAIEFYKKAFQFSVLEIKCAEDGKGIHAEMAYKNQLILCGKEGACSLRSPRSSGVESPITLCVLCDDVDTFYTMAVSQGAQSISPPDDMDWGYRMCRLQDLDHYTWCFMTPVF